MAALPSPERERILHEVANLPDSWHSAGTLHPKALSALIRHATSQPIRRSIETGTGRSTLILSHVSDDHTVFTLGGDGDTSYAAVTSSPLLNAAHVRFVLGPTQRTLQSHRFESGIQFALIDGPHGYPFPDLEYFWIYPHLEKGAILVVDDVHIPTVFNLFAVLREDAMFDLVEVAATTAFFRRTGAPTFPLDQDNWWTQGYNARRFPVSDWPRWGAFATRMRGAVPVSVRKRLKTVVPAGVRKRFRS